MTPWRACVALGLALALSACYASHEGSRPFDAGPLGGPGAYPIPFAMESTEGSPITLRDDEVSAPIDLGFSFRFFDSTYTRVVVSSNGFLSFVTSVDNGCCRGNPIPGRDDVDGIVAYAWTDLFPPGGGTLRTETRGSAPNRRFVLSAVDQAWCCDTGSPRVTAQVILREGSDLVEVHVLRQSSGHQYTQGVEDESGRRAFFRPGRVATDYALERDATLFITR